MKFKIWSLIEHCWDSTLRIFVQRSNAMNSFLVSSKGLVLFYYLKRQNTFEGILKQSIMIWILSQYSLMNSSTLLPWMILMLDHLVTRLRLGSQLFVSINLQYLEAISWSFNALPSLLVQSNYCMILNHKKTWKQASYLWIRYILVLLCQKEQHTSFSTWTTNRQRLTKEYQY